MGYDCQKLKMILQLQAMNVLFSLNSVLLKIDSILWERNGLLQIKTIAVFLAGLTTPGIYAFLWQKTLEKIELSVAYINKGMITFWGMLWSYFFFHEQITVGNIIGCMIISVGTYLVA